MKIDYNILMKKQINNIINKPKLLLHVCCAPCSSAVLDKLSMFDLSLFYFNPNTYPKEEYDLRAEQFPKLSTLPFIKYEYNHNQFLDIIKDNENQPEGGERCKKCIELRLRKTFEYAKNFNFDFVTTTLTISPHKDAEFINTLGEKLSKEYNIKFLNADFKKENGFLDSINISKRLNLYRQDYCGCEFSKNNTPK